MQSVRNVYAKFKVDRLSRFRTGARQVFTTQKPFHSEIPLTKETTTSNLNIFSNQITIVKFLLKSLTSKQIYTREKK